jgi:predicted acylesterase/phospholipase RssA
MDMIADSPRPSRPRVGLVLGAGGVRGCAHAGVVGVLRQAGVPIDLVVGASVGSIFGLAVAAGLPTEYMQGVIRQSSAFELLRFYAGRLRADRRNPISRMVWDAGNGKRFEDLELPFAAMATDMESGKVVAFTRGPVVPAIEASIALPLIARPVQIGGRHYVDGGIIDTAPVPVAHRMGADVVIAVCLGGNFTAPSYIRNRPWTHPLVEKIGSRRKGGVRLHHQIRFGAWLYSASMDPAHPAEDADIAIWPEFGRIGPNSMVGGEFCLEQGIKAAEDALPLILEVVENARAREGQIAQRQNP